MPLLPVKLIFQLTRASARFPAESTVKPGTVVFFLFRSLPLFCLPPSFSPCRVLLASVVVLIHFFFFLREKGSRSPLMAFKTCRARPRSRGILKRANVEERPRLYIWNFCSVFAFFSNLELTKFCANDRSKIWSRMKGRKLVYCF